MTNKQQVMINAIISVDMDNNTFPDEHYEIKRLVPMLIDAEVPQMKKVPITATTNGIPEKCEIWITDRDDYAQIPQRYENAIKAFKKAFEAPLE